MMEYSKININENKVFAIIVTYNPDVPVLKRLVDALKNQVDTIVIVDNSTCYFSQDVFEDEKILFINNNGNLGLSRGQNIGIEYAIENYASHVLIFDQDSEPDSEMVKNLLSAEKSLLNLGCKVAAVGPIYLDVKTKKISPFVYLKNKRFIKKIKPDFGIFAEASCLISSGQLIRCDILLDIGLMKEEYFIDFVDIEWGLRAGVKGYKSFGIFNAQMKHNLGDSFVRVGEKNVSIHSEIRNYYIMRNAILMYKDEKIPMNWKIADSTKFAQRFILSLIFSKRKIINLQFMLRGMMDGLKGKDGEYR